MPLRTKDASEEFDEFDTTVAEFDEMMAAAEPITVDALPTYPHQLLHSTGQYYTLRMSSRSQMTAGAWGRPSTWEAPVTK